MKIADARAAAVAGSTVYTLITVDRRPMSVGATIADERRGYAGRPIFTLAPLAGTWPAGASTRAGNVVRRAASDLHPTLPGPSFTDHAGFGSVVAELMATESAPRRTAEFRYGRGRTLATVTAAMHAARAWADRQTQ